MYNTTSVYKSDEVKQLKIEMDSLVQSRQEAEDQANSAVIKIEVLSSYFKEKEDEINRLTH